jgi:ABC-2 type transport system permease protein
MTAINNISAIIQKEWRHYFGSPIAYVVLFVWTFLFGAFFTFGLSWFIAQSAQMGMDGGKASLNDHLIRHLLLNMTVVAMFITPMITMRLFAEEKRQGTMELLSTVPLTDMQIVLGKFLAALGLYALMIAASLSNFIFLWMYSTPVPEWKPVASGALGLLLLGSCYIAIGTFLSNLTRNQMIAGILTFCAVLGLLVLSWADDPMGGPIKKVVAYMAVNTHLNDLLKGVINLKDVLFYLSFTTFGLFLAHQSVASQRWRA